MLAKIKDLVGLCANLVFILMKSFVKMSLGRSTIQVSTGNEMHLFAMDSLGY